MSYEVDLKQGGGDISRSSLVFRCSKDSEAYGRPLLRHIRNTKLNAKFKSIKLKLSESVYQVSMKGDYIVMSRSLHTRIASLSVFLPKTSSPARTCRGGIFEES
jgi:hypothetical protein